MTDFDWAKDKLTQAKLDELVKEALGGEGGKATPEILEKLKAMAANKAGGEVTAA